VTDALAAVLTALADDELVIGHRHSEWTGFAPHIEEDVAFSSIAQDEIGHAAALYGLVSQLTGVDPDRLALGREPHEYRNAIFCERANADWAYSLARHWLYDRAEALRLEALERSTHPELAALARKLRREERYHLLHADAWMRRLAHGPVEGRGRLVDALTRAFAEARALFEPFEHEEIAVAEGWLPESSPALGLRFLQDTGAELDALGLPPGIRGSLDDEAAEFVASSSGDLIAHAEPSTRPTPASNDAWGGRAGRHSGELEALWAEMTSTYRVSPGASW
jgi:ring-1,2-phenylacetyl-CoA epoxidase subunit PaaC